MKPIRWSVIFLLALLAATPLLMAQQTPAPGKATYVGIKNCKMCHSDIHKAWMQKAHSRAFELLVAVKQDKNEKCLPCHTTGYGDGGFVDVEKTPDLKGVTCEACHGPGSEHNGEGKITKIPLSTVCVRCHMKMDIH